MRLVTSSDTTPEMHNVVLFTPKIWWCLLMSQVGQNPRKKKKDSFAERLFPDILHWKWAVWGYAVMMLFSYTCSISFLRKYTGCCKREKIAFFSNWLLLYIRDVTGTQLYARLHWSTRILLLTFFHLYFNKSHLLTSNVKKQQQHFHLVCVII